MFAKRVKFAVAKIAENPSGRVSSGRMDAS